MKFFSIAVLLGIVIYKAEAVSISHLPDVRPDTVADADIAAHERARAEAAKIKKNP